MTGFGAAAGAAYLDRELLDAAGLGTRAGAGRIDAMRKPLMWVALAAGAAGLLAWLLLDRASSLVEATLPAFPELPPPLERLTDQREGIVTFASRTPFDLDVLLRAPEAAIPTTGIGTLFLPPEASPDSPVPAMVVLHGSGGISPGRELSYGALLRDHGFAALVVDYYAPRGIDEDTPYMLRVLSVTEFDAIADAYAARRILATHPAIDADRIGVMGFSYGGMAARFAMDERLRSVLDPGTNGFAAFVDYYGPCFQDLGTKATNGAPLLTLRGTEDASNDLAACERREGTLRALGVPVEAHVYEGAGHAWEVDVPRKLSPDSPYVVGCEVVYDESGRSSLNGAPIVDVPPETARAERVLIRMRSGRPMADCVKNGYVIGRDDATRARSDAALLAFLSGTLGG